MASTNASRTSVRDEISNLQFQLYQAHRRVDRFMRLYYWAKEEAVKPRWLELAKRNDQLAADLAKKLSEIPDNRS